MLVLGRQRLAGGQHQVDGLERGAPCALAEVEHGLVENVLGDRGLGLCFKGAAVVFKAPALARQGRLHALINPVATPVGLD